MSDLASLNEQELSRKTRPELEEYAVELGLADVKTFANKPAVLDAIKRVKGGDDVATVNDELKVVVNDDDAANATPPVDPNVTDDEEVDDDDETASDAPKKARKAAHHKNQGHPTEFDETGKPVYR